MHIYSLVRAVFAACALAAVLAVPVSAAPVVSQLRVEGPGLRLDPGYWYLNDTSTFDTATSCGGTGENKTLAGPTALGLLNYGADYNKKLAPVAVSDEFDFGLFVCGIGAYPAEGDGFWGLRVNHAEATVGGDQIQLEPWDTVLWTYISFEKKINTGKELVLQTTDDRVEAGQPAEVRVLEYDAEGNATPAKGVLVGGQLTDEEGNATVVFDEPGRPVLRARRGSDIPSAPKRFCVWEGSDDGCETLSLGRIVGTLGDDELEGSSNPEFLVGRAGDDTIDSRSGSAVDVVSCGIGTDTVIADKGDRVRRDCEKVKRK